MYRPWTERIPDPSAAAISSEAGAGGGAGRAGRGRGRGARAGVSAPSRVAPSTGRRAVGRSFAPGPLAAVRQGGWPGPWVTPAAAARGFQTPLGVGPVAHSCLAALGYGSQAAARVRGGYVLTVAQHTDARGNGREQTGEGDGRVDRPRPRRLHVGRQEHLRGRDNPNLVSVVSSCDMTGTSCSVTRVGELPGAR